MELGTEIYSSWCEPFEPNVDIKKRFNIKQAGAELYQAQFKLGLARHGLSS